MSRERMQALFADVTFIAELNSAYKQGRLKTGAPCPSGCGGTLKRTKKDWFDSSTDPWTHKEVVLISCGCGFQMKIGGDDP